MSVVKSLVGSVIGAAVATGIFYGIQQSTGETYIWFPLVTGALTGIVARVFGGSTSTTASFVCGAFAALVAGIAIFGIDLGPKLMEMNADRGPVAANELMEDPASLVKSNIPKATNTDADEAGDATAKSTGDADGSSDADASGQVNVSADANAADANAADANAADANAADADRSRMPDAAKNAEAAAGASGTPAVTATLPAKEDSFLGRYLPYIFNGIGILFAYQIARGFGPSTPKDGKDA